MDLDVDFILIQFGNRDFLFYVIQMYLINFNLFQIIENIIYVNFCCIILIFVIKNNGSVIFRKFIFSV